MNSSLSHSSKQKCFDLISGVLALEAFEQWVYASKELEQELSETDHLALISFNFKKNGAKYELIQLLKRFVDLGEYETQKVREKLVAALNKEENLPELLAEFYDLNCRGYAFLQDIGMGFGLSIEVPPVGNHDKTWDQLSEAEQEEIISGFYPQLDECLRDAIHWLDAGKIVLTGEKELDNDYFLEYHDYRTEAERKSRCFKEVRKKWWQFWKPKLKQSGNFEPD